MLGTHEVGIIGRVVGASFAVLVAEELFASGCRLLVSLTSAGQIVPAGPPPYFVVIDRALRGEGTSYHYLPPSEFAEAAPALVATVAEALTTLSQRSVVGPSWTADAPFRETAAAIEAARAKNILAVEMEAAAFRLCDRRKSNAEPPLVGKARVRALHSSLRSSLTALPSSGPHSAHGGSSAVGGPR